jgi:hypothetical protein
MGITGSILFISESEVLVDFTVYLFVHFTYQMNQMIYLFLHSLDASLRLGGR